MKHFRDSETKYIKTLKEGQSQQKDLEVKVKSVNYVNQGEITEKENENVSQKIDWFSDFGSSHILGLFYSIPMMA